MLYKTTNNLGSNTFCHFCLNQIDKNAKCFRHNIMLFCSENCFDLWCKESHEEYISRNKRMFGILIDGRIKNDCLIKITLKEKLKFIYAQLYLIYPPRIPFIDSKYGEINSIAGYYIFSLYYTLRYLFFPHFKYIPK